VHDRCCLTALVSSRVVEVRSLLMMGKGGADVTRVAADEAKFVRCGGLTALVAEVQVRGEGFIGVAPGLAVGPCKVTRLNGLDRGLGMDGEPLATSP
jgi:hypothetical protein